MLKSVTKKLKPFIEAKLNEEYVSIANDANLYCLDYIEERLKRSNIDSDLEFIRPKAVSESLLSISAKIIEVGELLETTYPHLYNNVSKQLKVKLRSEVIVGDIFRNFGRELFREGITWGRIVALFAFAAAISADCITQGRPELVKNVLSCVRLYVLDHLAVWIRSQGGWDTQYLLINHIPLGDTKPPGYINRRLKTTIQTPADTAVTWKKSNPRSPREAGLTNKNSALKN
ncbi:bcl-2-related ovarian killer protein-like isoform X2 [Stylophora pistillata]|uniref:bcl-2-related ovarian killer protein-like isoform X2 n=1 Tax=Stylophora pistillata TaxID=50429 RepID=UPI000C04036E|nr:bcl-2-related ovarian killer protein-like isoform X2 [Stylophora pistillata]